MKTSVQEIWDKQDLWKETVAAKLRNLWDSNQVSNLNRCGQEKLYRTCKDCGETKTFEYHCDLKWCPRCQWRITARRMESIREWSSFIKQPKHLVTTQRNFQVLTHRQIQRHKKNLAKLRRSKCFEKVKGGCVSVEITNESRGWHLHAHWLLDARWIPVEEVSRTWGELVEQDEGAIVKVKDLRGTTKNYVAEVAKYVCKGSDIASWQPNEILEFVRAIQGTRFFFRFGSLFKHSREKKQREIKFCACGAHRFIFRSEFDQTCHDIREATRTRRR